MQLRSLSMLARGSELLLSFFMIWRMFCFSSGNSSSCPSSTEATSVRPESMMLAGEGSSTSNMWTK